jgi:photosystem II stability/assembly factor-like uncharacterized protein
MPAKQRLAVGFLLGCCLLMLAAGPLFSGAGAWTPTGPYGGLIRCLAVDPSTPSTLYAGAAKGVYKTTDGGGTWRAVFTSQHDLDISSIAIDPSSPSTVYAGSSNGGILKSTDDCMTWTWLDSVMGKWGCMAVLSLAFDPFSPGTLYAGIMPVWVSDLPDVGVYKTTDGGTTWIPAGGGLENMAIHALVFDPAVPGTIYAAGYGYWNGRVYKTTDGGDHWVAMDAGLPGGWGWIVTLGIDPASPSILYAGTEGNGVYKTVNGGLTWSVTGLQEPYSISSLAVEPSDPKTLYAGTLDPSEEEKGIVLKSTDGGQTWRPAYFGLAGMTPYALAVDPLAPSIVYAGAGGGEYSDLGGVFKTTNGGSSWDAANWGINEIEITALAASPSSPLIAYAGTRIGVYKTDDGGATWSPSGMGDAQIYALSVDPEAPAVVWAATSQGVLKSIDGGKIWNPNYYNGAPLRAQKLAIAAVDPDTVYAAASGSKWKQGGVFKTTDGGETWNDAGMSQYIRGIAAFSVDPSDASTVYVNTYPTDDRASCILYKTTDGGTTWASANGNLTDLLAHALVIDPSDPAVLYAATRGAVFKSKDGGAIWGATGLAGYGYYGVYSLIMDPSDPAILFAGVEENGVLMTKDGGASWYPLPEGLPFRNPSALALLPSDPPTLLAATDRGVWSLTLSGHTRPLGHP